MKNPTIVMTRTKTSDNSSRENAIDGEKPATSIHVQSVFDQALPAGGEPIKLMPASIATSADSPTEPTPMNALTERETRGPVRRSRRKPAKGSAGMSQRSSSIRDHPSQNANCKMKRSRESF